MHLFQTQQNIPHSWFSATYTFLFHRFFKAAPAGMEWSSSHNSRWPSQKDFFQSWEPRGKTVDQQAPKSLELVVRQSLDDFTWSGPIRSVFWVKSLFQLSEKTTTICYAGSFDFLTLHPKLEKVPRITKFTEFYLWPLGPDAHESWRNSLFWMKSLLRLCLDKI